MIEQYKLGLIGYPLEHSLSPLMHNAALKALGLEGEYRLYPIPPLPEGAGALAKLLESLRRGDLHGLNVTIPHKQAVMDCLDELTARAREIGAVNTLYMQDGRLMGDNTDAAGFLADLGRLLLLSERYGSHQGGALVLGAGGSARAVVYALATSGWQVTVAARRLAQAQALAASLRPCLANSSTILCLPLTASDLLVDPPPRLIVNTTPVGMFKRPPEPAFPGGPSLPAKPPGAPDGASPWPVGLSFPGGAVLYDLVYNPPVTPLMKEARADGLQAANGLGMLVEQAALSFERWTGRTAPRTVMEQALEKK